MNSVSQEGSYHSIILISANYNCYYEPHDKHCESNISRPRASKLVRDRDRTRPASKNLRRQQCQKGIGTGRLPGS